MIDVYLYYNIPVENTTVGRKIIIIAKIKQLLFCADHYSVYFIH